eukprot:m.476764 g.476764  ORF g.476764 m.476764 type:complete len:316 (-) comp20645_c0_seq1:157-1104(-)
MPVVPGAVTTPTTWTVGQQQQQERLTFFGPEMTTTTTTTSDPATYHLAFPDDFATEMLAFPAPSPPPTQAQAHPPTSAQGQTTRPNLLAAASLAASSSPPPPLPSVLNNRCSSSSSSDNHSGAMLGTDTDDDGCLGDLDLDLGLALGLDAYHSLYSGADQYGADHPRTATPDFVSHTETKPDAKPARTKFSAASPAGSTTSASQEDEFGLSLARMTTGQFKAYLKTAARGDHADLKKLRRRYRGRTYASNARLRRIAKHRETASKAQQAAQRAHKLNTELQNLHAEISRLRTANTNLCSIVAAAGLKLPSDLVAC